MSTEPFDFRMISTPAPRSGEQNRDPNGGTVYPSGRTPLNAGGTGEYLQLARDSGCNVENFVAQYGVLDGTGMMCAYAVPLGTPDAAAFRRCADGNITLHFGGVFKETPQIRVPTRVECQVFRGKDKKGRDCLILDLGTGLEKRVRRARQKKQDQGQGQPSGSQVQAAARSGPDQATAEQK